MIDKLDGRRGSSRLEQLPLRNLDGLLVKTGVVVMVTMMMMVMVMGLYDHNNLRLSRIGHCETEKEK
jgi:hypothetical protein